LQQRFFQLAIFAISIITLANSCTKLDTTTEGSDLVTVDNINTFSKSFDVVTTQGVFTNDSTMINKTDNHVIGKISDPKFGSTEAELYLQFKPAFFPYYFGSVGDTVKGASVPRPDSIYLCLSYRGVWGDSSASAIPQKLEVFTVLDNLFKSKTDTLFAVGRYRPATSTSIGSALITPKIAAQKSYFGKPSKIDSVENQIRILLDASFVNYIFNSQDSTTTSGAPNNAYNKDSIFRERLNGFCVKSTGLTGNSLFYVNLTDTKTRLEFHYDKINAGVKDTVMTPFYFYSTATAAGNPASSSCNYVKRNYSGFPRLSSPSNLAVTDYIDIQNAPGTFASIKIPELTTWRNTKDKIIHRAYLMVDQTDGASASVYTSPSYMYLDLKDSAIANRYKPIYFDLSSQLNYNPDVTDLSALFHPYPSSNVDIASFGGKALQRTEAGETFTRYEINVTRYVQHIVSNNFYNYDMRLYAPFNYYYGQYLRQYVIPYYNQLAYGSVRVGAGTTANVPHKMKLVVIYSKVKV
jgi:Domain of unknown function (DUF4270)